MDRLLGGGLPLGSLTLIFEDGWSQHHITLLKYFLCEGAACNQRTLLLASTEPEGGISSFLPKLLDPVAAEKEKEAKKKVKEEDAVQLKIAWQYGRYLKPEHGTASGNSTGLSSVSSGVTGGSGLLQSTGQQKNSLQNRSAGRDWCHSYDLSKPAFSSGGGSGGISNGGLDASTIEPLEFILCGSNNGCLLTKNSSREHLVTSTASFIPKTTISSAAQNQPKSTTTSSVSRIAVLSLGDAAWNIGDEGGKDNNTSTSSGAVGSCESRRSTIQSLLQLKSVVRDTRSCIIVTVPAALYTASDKKRMSHIADVVLSLEAVQDDSDVVRLAPDPSSVSGLLHLQKLASMGSICAPAPQNPLYLVRSKRRRMAITPVEIDPDAEETEAAGGGQGGGGGGGGGRTPASALLCGGPAKGKPDLDF
jgi:elongator complex protein 4